MTVVGLQKREGIDIKSGQPIKLLDIYYVFYCKSVTGFATGVETVDLNLVQVPDICLGDEISFYYDYEVRRVVRVEVRSSSV